MLKIRPLPIDFTWLSPVVWLVTWGHSGRLAPASGTWGSLAAMPFALGILYVGGWPALLAFALIVAWVGYWAIPRYTKALGVKDPSEIVLDEVVGIALTFLPLLSFDIPTVLLGFAAFRLLDALKPGPIGWCDKHLDGAQGVIMDDVVAGIMAAICVYSYQTLI